MKICLTFILLTLCLCSFAQTDSTEIKLQRYKELHEKKLINNTEYELLKSKELDLLEVPKAKKDTVNLNSLRRTFKTQITLGSLELAAGASLVASWAYLRNKLVCAQTSISNHSPKCEYQTTPARICFAMAAVFGGVGIYSVVKGAKNRSKYIDQISVSPTSASISIRF